MRRSPVLLLFCALAVSTGLAMLGVAQALPWSADATPDAANEVAVRRYYAAVDTVLRAGDRTQLLAIVGDDFVDHDPFPGVTRDRAGLEQALLALHAVAPAMTLEIETVVADGDRVMARVNAWHGSPLFLGTLFEQDTAVWPAFDLFRLRNGLIVEHWGAADELILPQPLVEAPLTAVPAGLLAVGVTRLTLAPGALVPALVNPGPAIFAVETGALDVLDTGAVWVNRSADHTTATSRDAWSSVRGNHVLGAGDRLVLPADTLYTLGNSGATPIVVLATVLFPLGPGAPSVEALYLPGEVGMPPPPNVAALWPDGVSAEPLLRGKLTSVRPGTPVVLALSQIALGPAAQATRETETATELWMIRSGSGSLTLNVGTAQIFSASGESGSTVVAGSSGTVGASLTQGSSGTVVLAPGSAGVWRSATAAPLEAMVLTLTENPNISK